MVWSDNISRHIVCDGGSNRFIGHAYFPFLFEYRISLFFHSADFYGAKIGI